MISYTEIVELLPRVNLVFLFSDLCSSNFFCSLLDHYIDSFPGLHVTVITSECLSPTATSKVAINSLCTSSISSPPPTIFIIINYFIVYRLAYSFLIFSMRETIFQFVSSPSLALWTVPHVSQRVMKYLLSKLQSSFNLY